MAAHEETGHTADGLRPRAARALFPEPAESGGKTASEPVGADDEAKMGGHRAADAVPPIAPVGSPTKSAGRKNHNPYGYLSM